MLKLLKDKLSQSVKCDWYGSWFWNGFYIFKILMYFFLLIDFNLLMNTLLFIATHAHLKNVRLQKYYKILIAILCFALLYHDSYLPSIRQIIAQKSNLTGFSLSYVTEFLIDFINLKLIALFIAAVLLLKIASAYIRGSTLVVLCFVLCQTISSENLIKNFSKDNNVPITNNFVFKNKDLIEQRGNFNNTNLNKYLDTFFKKESNRSIDVLYQLEAEFKPFNIVLLTVDNISNQDLSSFNSNDVYALKRFNLYLTGFNAVTTDFNESKLRLFQGVCGQKDRDGLLNKETKKCSLVEMLENLGYDATAFFNSQEDKNNLSEYLSKYTIFTKKINPSVNDPRILYKSKKDKNIYNDEDIFDSYIKYVAKSDLVSFAYINSASLLEGNTEGNFEVSYEKKLTSLLVKINRFIDRLEEIGKPTLLIMVPSSGAALRGDKTQLKGMRAIPSDGITNTTAMIKFLGMKKQPQTVSLKDPVSYQAIAYIISKAITDNIFSEKLPLSVEAFSEDIPRTELVGETDSYYFIKYKNKFFYKTTQLGSNWKEYVK